MNMFKRSAVSYVSTTLILTLIIIGGTLGYLVLQPSIASGESWLTGWQYRKSHVINATAGAGTNYQVKITVYYGAGSDSGGAVYCNSHCKSDFGDVCFTRSDGATLLDYWMESYTSSSAVFWVEVADDLSTVNQTIYVYYGKSDAISISNFDNTFIFGDPFDSATLNTSRWTSVDGNPTYTIDTTNHFLEVTDMDGYNWWTGKGFHSKALTLPASWIIEDAYNNVNGIYICEITSAAAQENMGTFSLAHTSYSSTDYGIVSAYVGDAWVGTSGYDFGLGAGGNIDYETYTSTGGSSYTAYWIAKKLSGTITILDSGTQRVSEANSETPSIFHLGISRTIDTAFGTQRFGAFKIRKYVSPEPIHGSWGTEETPNNPPTNDLLDLDLFWATYKDEKTLLCAEEDYDFYYQCSDANGVTTISYAQIQLDPTGKNVILRATRGAGDVWTFSEYSDPNDYVTLNTGASSHSTSGTQKTFDFLVAINWNWGDSAETVGVRCYVVDSQSASDTDDYANVFGVEAHLTSASLTVSDYRVNPSQTLTFSGYWYYDGTSIAPPNGNYAVAVKLLGVQKGSTDTTLVSGAFSISDVTAEATVSSYSYTIEATHMTGAGSVSAVIVDKIRIVACGIVGNVIDTRTGGKAWYQAVYEYDNASFTNSKGILYLNGSAMIWAVDRWTYAFSYQTSGNPAVFHITSVTESTYGLTVINNVAGDVILNWATMQITVNKP